VGRLLLVTQSSGLNRREGPTSGFLLFSLVRMARYVLWFESSRERQGSKLGWVFTRLFPTCGSKGNISYTEERRRRIKDASLREFPFP